MLRGLIEQKELWTQKEQKELGTQKDQEDL